jgi:B9 domain-containing protein 1
MSSTGRGSGGSSSKGGDSRNANNFYIMCTGQVESAQFPGVDNLYCRYQFKYGADWKVLQGVDVGLSQIAQRGTHNESTIVWNFPIDVTFASTNAFGWPRIVLSVYGIDAFGRDVVHGYGSVLVPTVAGTYTRYVRLFKPLSSSLFQSVQAWITGQRPEFFDVTFIAQGEGREVTRVQSTGVVKVTFNMMAKNLAQHGYSEAANVPKHFNDMPSRFMIDPEK